MAEDTTCQVVLTRVSQGFCAFSIADVIEIMRPCPVQPVPEAPDWVLGLAVIRGGPVPVVDLGRFLAASEPRPAGRWLTLRIAGRQVAVAVPEVLGVRGLKANLFRDLPPLTRGAAGVTSAGVLDNELLLVLEAARVVPEELLSKLLGEAAPS